MLRPISNAARYLFLTAGVGLFAQPAGTAIAVHRNQNIEAHFSTAGARFLHAGSSFTMALSGAPATHLTSKDARVELHHGAITEWYVNLPEGVEHGFTIHQRQHAAPLIRIAISGDYRPALGPDGVVLLGPGNRSLRYGGLAAWDASGRDLPARASVAGTEIHLSVDDTGAQYPVTVDPIVQEQPIIPSDAAINDSFGSPVAISGDTAVVGAPSRNNNAGEVIVYVRSNGAWVEQQRLAPSTTPINFGVAVAISGDTLVAGAPAEGSNQQGAAYVFTRAAGHWTMQARLLPRVDIPAAAFGSALAIDRDRIVVGAPNFDPVGGYGLVYIFNRTGTTWNPDITFPIDFAKRLGVAVAVDGQTVAIASARELLFEERVTDPPDVYVYSLSPLGWTLQARLTEPLPVAGARFGHSIALSGNTLLVGAPGSSTAPNEKVYEFTRSGSVWSLRSSLSNSSGRPGELYGSAVALSGGLAIIGAPGGGAAYLLSRNGTVWSSQRLTAPNVKGFGTAVAVSGIRAIVGSPGSPPSSVGSGETGGIPGTTGQAHPFALQNVSILSNPTRMPFTLSGTGCDQTGNFSTPYTGYWTNCTLAWIKPPTLTDTRSVWQSWSDGSIATPRLFTPNPDPLQPLATYIGNFATQYLLSTQSVPLSGGVVTGGDWYPQGANAAVAAIPAPGFVFTGFGGALNGGKSPATILMDGPKTISGNFTLTPAASLSAAVLSKSSAGTSKVWTLALTNNGPGVAYNPQLFLLMFTQTFGTQCARPPVRVSPAALPLALNTLSVGASVQIPVAIDFGGCADTARFTVSAGYMSNGGASTGVAQLLNQLPGTLQ